MVQESVLDRFMKLEKTKVPKDWLDLLRLTTKLEYVVYDENKSMLEQVNNLGSKHLLVIKSAAQIGYYDLMGELEQTKKEFKIYHILNNQYIIGEVYDG